MCIQIICASAELRNQCLVTLDNRYATVDPPVSYSLPFKYIFRQKPIEKRDTYIDGLLIGKYEEPGRLSLKFSTTRDRPLNEPRPFLLSGIRSPFQADAIFFHCPGGLANRETYPAHYLRHIRCHPPSKGKGPPQTEPIPPRRQPCKAIEPSHSEHASSTCHLSC